MNLRFSLLSFLIGPPIPRHFDKRPRTRFYPLKSYARPPL
jgi:hypothetical protein